MRFGFGFGFGFNPAVVVVVVVEGRISECSGATATWDLYLQSGLEVRCVDLRFD